MDRRPDIKPVRRRPVGAPVQQWPEPVVARADAVDDLLDDYFALPVSAPAAAQHSKQLEIRQGTTQLSIATRLQAPVQTFEYSNSSSAARSPGHSAPTSPLPPPPAYSPGVTPDTPIHLVPVTPDAQPPSKPFWKTAIDETVYFAGGLVSHPAESTRHYTVLRHSPGLIFYKGPSTRVTLTIFSDNGPLPPGRTLWLQRKGFSGDMGMGISSFFGTDSAWIDVTPCTQVLASEVAPEDERAWQRDISKFVKKAADHKRLSKHKACETCVVRVPASAADGYMRIVVCAGTQGGAKTDDGAPNKGTTKKKSLCPSPVFRVASTSRDMSVVRGASLRTLPLELGIRAATAIGERYVTTVAAPVVGAVQAGAKRVEKQVERHSSRAVAMVKTGVAENLVAAEDRYAPIRHETWGALHETSIHDSPPETVGSEDGPEHPFPMMMYGKVVPGTGRSRADTGFPTANLSGVSGDLLLRLNGVYLGWVTVASSQQLYGSDNDLHKAIITIGPPTYGVARVATENTASIYVIQESADHMLDILSARVDVIIMGHLRPLPRRDPAPPPQHLAALMRENIAITTASLSRDAWHHHHQRHLVDAATTRNPLLKALKTHKSFSDFASHASAGLQRRVDSVPLHLAGVRTTGNELKDHAYGTGGYYVKR